MMQEMPNARVMTRFVSIMARYLMEWVTGDRVNLAVSGPLFRLLWACPVILNCQPARLFSPGSRFPVPLLGSRFPVPFVLWSLQASSQVICFSVSWFACFLFCSVPFPFPVPWFPLFPCIEWVSLNQCSILEAQSVPTPNPVHLFPVPCPVLAGSPFARF